MSKKSKNKKRNRTLSAMPTTLYKELVNLCYVQSCGSNEKLMVLYLADKLDKIPGVQYFIDAVGNILVVKGQSENKIYPCIVAHMDTVHSIVDNFTIYSEEVNNSIRLFAKSNKSKTGIGGDDKCGVFACLYMLKQLPSLKVVFFTQEETGLKGSNNIAHGFFDDVSYIIQLDRRGSIDFIDKYIGDKTVSPDFTSEISNLKKDYGFKSTTGIITDSIHLWDEGIGISCVNISCGYYRPHSNNEYIDVNILWNSILFTKALMQILKHKRYECVRPEKKWDKSYNYYNKNTKHKNIVGTYKQCKICKKYKPKSNGLISSTYNGWVCYECWSGNTEKNDGTTGNSNWFRCCVCEIITHKTKGAYQEKYNHQWTCDSCFNKDAPSEFKVAGNKDNNSMSIKCRVCEEDTYFSDYTEINKQGKYLEKFGWKWVCNGCIVVVNQSERLRRCEICGLYQNDFAEYTKLQAAAIGLRILKQRGIICTNCLTKPLSEIPKTQKVLTSDPMEKDETQPLDPKKCDICDAVVNKSEGVENILNVNFVCNNCVITHGSEKNNE